MLCHASPVVNAASLFKPFRMAALESVVDVKGEQAKNLSDHIVQVRSAIKGIFGADSAEYDMVGGTRTSAEAACEEGGAAGGDIA